MTELQTQEIQVDEIEGQETFEGMDEIVAEPPSVAQVVADLVKDEHDEDGTPYEVHKIVNAALEVFEVKKIKDGKETLYQVPPQMMYNYDRNGLIVKGSKGLKRYTKAQVFEFVTKFVGKQTTK